MTIVTLDDLDAGITNNVRIKYAKSAQTLFNEEEAEYPDNFVFDIFLSHSYRDHELNRGRIGSLRRRIEGLGYSVYVDWIIDRHLPREEVDRQTAHTLRHRMNHSQCLFFATSERHQESKWMPWELGYMDGRTSSDGKNSKVAIFPLLQPHGQMNYNGQEYLGMYPYVDIHKADDGNIYLWVNESEFVYANWRWWMNGLLPYQH